MAYSQPRQPDPDQEIAGPGSKTGPVLREIFETLKAPISGFWQGFGGKNLTWEQLRREKTRSRGGRSPGRYPGRGPLSWLERLIR